MSVNLAWCGKRFKTKQYQQYEKDCLKLIKGKKIMGNVEIHYKFFIKNFLMSDVGNFEKPLTDIIVKAGLIEDDRFVQRIIMEKYKSNDERIEIFISKF